MSRAPIAAEDVATALAASGMSSTDAEASRLAAFLNLLEQWSDVYNLTGIKTRPELLARHLVESLALGPWLVGGSVADIGTGAGLPGLPLAICHPESRFTLIESRRKRVNFLRHVVATLKLEHVAVAHCRAEELEIEEPFATVLARAVAPPRQLLEIVRPLTGPGSRLLLLTSGELAAEITAIASDFVVKDTEHVSPRLKSAVVALDRINPSAAQT